MDSLAVYTESLFYICTCRPPAERPLPCHRRDDCDGRRQQLRLPGQVQGGRHLYCHHAATRPGVSSGAG